MKMIKHCSLFGSIVAAIILLTCGLVRAQQSGVAYSPGAALDQQSWEQFIIAVSPVDGGMLRFETWKTDAQTFPKQALTAQAEPSRFQASVQARVLARAHLPSGLTSLESVGGNPLPVSCNQPSPNPDLPPSNPPAPPAAYFPTPYKASPPFGCVAEEVRRNKLSSDHIETKGLNTQVGLVAAYNPGGAIPAFPNGAVELKADWIPVTTLVQWLRANGRTVTVAEVDKNYYHVTEKGTEYALVAMHLSIKTADHPDWIWATFEHQWNPGRCDTVGCYDQYGISASLQAIPPVPLPAAPSPDTSYPSCTKSDQLAAKFKAAKLSSAWSNYCLKATQVDFVSPPSFTPPGQPVLDGNSLTERINAGVSISSSSCIACHKNASYTVVNPGTASARAAVNGAIAVSPIGNVTVSSPYTTYDFVWALAAAPDMFPAQ